MRFLCLGLIVAGSLAGRVPASAQLPRSQLAWVFPAGARVGSTNEITVSGADLDEPAGLLFSDPRLTATRVAGTSDRFQVVVPAEVPPGLVDVRFVGRFGASNPRAFAVGDRPEITLSAGNTTPESAIEVPLETTLNGRVLSSNVAWLRFTAAAGQRIMIHAESRALDSRLVPVLTVIDSEGRERAVARRREWLDFTAPTEGGYLLKLSDETFGGGDDFYFRLTLGTGPRLDFAVPNVLRLGEANQVTLFGRHLPGGRPSVVTGRDGRTLEQLEVEIPAPTGAHPSARVVELLDNPGSASLLDESFAWRLEAANGRSNPLLFMLTSNVVFSATAGGLETVTLPCEFSGFFPPRGQLSGVTFQAGKGEVFWLEMFCDRLGFPCDPHALIQRERTEKGEQGETLYVDVKELMDTETNLGDREFNTATRDAAARFEAPETGRYRVIVRDRFNLGADRPRYPYRLSLRHETPDFHLVGLPMPPTRAGDNRRIQTQPVTLRRDETIALKVIAFRRDGFDGDIELAVTNLPAGVTAGATRIPTGENVGTLLLSSSAEAVDASHPVLLGRARVGAGDITRTGVLASVIWTVPDFNNENAAARLSRDSVLSVITAEQAPVSVAARAVEAIEVVVGTGLTVPLLIERRGDFSGAFNLKPAGHPAFDKAQDIAVPEKATNLTAEINLAESKLPVGSHTLWFQGGVAGKYRNNPEAVTLAEVELKAATEALASVSEADKPKAEERKKAAEAVKKAAEEKAKPRDVTVQVYSRPFVVSVLPEPQPEEKK